MTDKPKVANCGDCVFFDEQLDEYTKENRTWAEGTCRRYPDGDLKTRARWCGEFIDREGCPYGIYSRGFFRFPTQP